MKVSQWHLICGLRAEISKLLDRTLVIGGSGSGGGGRTVFRSHTRLVKNDMTEVTAFDRRKPDPAVSAQSSAVLAPVDPALLERLRDELLGHLEVLDERLSKELPEAEVQPVLFPLVLLCDEMVMMRLPKEQHTRWPLLQSDLFQINYGGDVFYELADEHLGKSTTPRIVFEVLYYCLHAGFVGRFGVDVGKVKRYRTLLSERLVELPETESAPEERSDAKEAMRLSKPPGRSGRRDRLATKFGSALSYYGAGLLLASVFLLLVAALTNL